MPSKKTNNWQSFIPVFVIILGIVLFFVFDLDKLLTFEMLKENRFLLLEFLKNNPILMPIIFILIYMIAIAFSLPGGAVLTVASGFLFGITWGTLYVVFAATIGATIIFLVAKTSVGKLLKEKAGLFISKLEKGFKKNAFNYLLFLRLVPLFPFFIINLVPAFLGVKTRTYILATFIGIIPGSFVFTSVGAGLGSVFDKGETFSINQILTTEVIIALVGLSVLALLPILFKAKSKKNS